GNENALLLTQDVIHDGPADGDLFPAIEAIAPAHRFRLKLGTVGYEWNTRSARASRVGCVCRRVTQHDAAAIGVEMAKDQLQDALQELIEIENVANGLRGLIHEVGQGVLKPRSLDLFRVSEDPATLGLADRLDNGRRQLNILTSNETDVIRK